MRAVEMTAPRTMRQIDVSKPSAATDEALIRLTEIAVCGSDLGFYLGTYDMEYPTRPGFPAHECVGVVEESGIEGFEPGDRVLWFPLDQDGIQEYVVAHNSDQLLKLPAEGDISRWMMAQLLGTVIHALRELGDVMSERIVVIGQGPVGQLFNHMLHNLGARMVIAVDRVPERLAVSPTMHASHTICVGSDATPGPAEALAEIQRLTGLPGADAVVEASGYDATIQMALSFVRRDGRYLQFGQPKSVEMMFNMWDVYQKRLFLKSTSGPEIERDYGMALEYIQTGRVNIDPLLTHRFALEDVNEAYETFANRADGCIKAVVEISSE